MRYLQFLKFASCCVSIFILWKIYPDKLSYSARGQNHEFLAIGQLVCERLWRKYASLKSLTITDTEEFTNDIMTLMICPRPSNVTLRERYRVELHSCCNATEELILTKRNTMLGEIIRYDAQSKTKLVDNSLLKMFPENMPWKTADPFRSCTVVGNGGILKNSSCGSMIDKADFVISPWVPKFSGKGGADALREWQAQMEAFLRAQGLSGQQKVDFVLSALEGDARREVSLAGAIKRNTEADIFTLLRALYGGGESVAQLRAHFFQCWQGAEEGVASFTLRLRELHQRWRAVDAAPAGGDDEMLRAQFSMGLRPGSVQQELQRQLRHLPYMTFASTCAEAKALERELDQREAQVCKAHVAQAAQVAPAVDPSWQKWRESLKLELQEELKDQVAAMSKVLLDDLKKFHLHDPLVAAHRDHNAPTVAAPSWPRSTQGPSRELQPFQCFRGVTQEKLRSNRLRPRWQGKLGGKPSQSAERRLCKSPVHDCRESPNWSVSPLLSFPEAEMVVWTSVPQGMGKADCWVLVEDHDDWSREWRVARALTWMRQGRVVLRLCNPNPFPVQVPQGLPLAAVDQVDAEDVRGQSELVFTHPEPTVVEVAVQSVDTKPTEDHPALALQGEGLTKEEQDRLATLLRKWSTVFAADEDDFGRTSAVLHRIPTGEAPPV
ncbi:hypothetical protein GJAV_G00196890 [Gymnothorax javanicus]|nr:hypothetical protein GJAV_G00196890 [Gymnothorax javanicus]